MAAIRSVRWMDAVVLVTGVMFVNQFVSHLDRGRFGESGYAELAKELIKRKSAPGWWNDVLRPRGA